MVSDLTVFTGKAIYEDYRIIKPALTELLAIFDDLLKDSWNIGR